MNSLMVTGLKSLTREFPGGLVITILGFHCRGPGSVPGWGTEISWAKWCGKKKKKKSLLLKIILLLYVLKKND